MNNQTESSRITISFGFLAAYIALFWGADFLPDNKPVNIVKIFALASAICFFLYLAFTSLFFTFDKKRVLSKIDKLQLSNKEIEKFRQWAFDAGISCIFESPLLGFYIWSFEITNNFKTIIGLIVILYLIHVFIAAIKHFLKRHAIRTFLYVFLTLSSILIIHWINIDSGKFILSTESEAGRTEVQISNSQEDFIHPNLYYGQLIEWISGKNWLSNENSFEEDAN